MHGLWTLESGTESSEHKKIIKDANGNVLNDGDTVTVIKDLKLKGSTSTVKIGTKVRNIRLVDGDHNIDCKIDGFGAMCLNLNLLKRYKRIEKICLTTFTFWNNITPKILLEKDFSNNCRIVKVRRENTFQVKV